MSPQIVKRKLASSSFKSSIAFGNTFLKRAFSFWIAIFNIIKKITRPKSRYNACFVINTSKTRQFNETQTQTMLYSRNHCNLRGVVVAGKYRCSCPRGAVGQGYNRALYHAATNFTGVRPHSLRMKNAHNLTQVDTITVSIILYNDIGKTFVAK